MWIATTLGFFSAVCARKGAGKGQPVDPNTIMVRARQRRHLQNLIDAFEDLSGVEIREGGTDYFCRMFVPKDTWAGILCTLASDTDYDNFKSAAHRDGADAPYLDFLHSTWGVGMRMQERVHRVGYGKRKVSEREIAGSLGRSIRLDLKHENWFEDESKKARKKRIRELLVEAEYPDGLIDEAVEVFMAEADEAIAEAAAK